MAFFKNIAKEIQFIFTVYDPLPLFLVIFGKLMVSFSIISHSFDNCNNTFNCLGEKITKFNEFFTTVFLP